MSWAALGPGGARSPEPPPPSRAVRRSRLSNSLRRLENDGVPLSQRPPHQWNLSGISETGKGRDMDPNPQGGEWSWCCRTLTFTLTLTGSSDIHPLKSVQERALRPKPTTLLPWAFLRAAAPVLKSPQFKSKFGEEKEQVDRCLGRVPRAPVGSDVMSMRRACKEGAGILAQVEWCNPSPTQQRVLGGSGLPGSETGWPGPGLYLQRFGTPWMADNPSGITLVFVINNWFLIWLPKQNAAQISYKTCIYPLTCPHCPPGWILRLLCSHINILLSWKTLQKFCCWCKVYNQCLSPLTWLKLISLWSKRKFHVVGLP